MSWNLEKTGGDVVFLIAGRDQAGMWNLISNTVTETSMELSYTLAAKMVEIQIFAVGAHEVHDIISVEVAGNQCQEDVPQPQEWREEEEEETNLDGLDVLEVIIEKDMETIIKENTSIAATVVLVLLSVFAVFFTVAIIIVRLRGQKPKEAQVGQFYEAVPELPYSPPVRTFKTEQTSPEVFTETLLQPRVISTIIESNEYEDVELSS